MDIQATTAHGLNLPWQLQKPLRGERSHSHLESSSSRQPGEPQDMLELSAQARERLEQEALASTENSSGPIEDDDHGGVDQGSGKSADSSNPSELTEEEKEIVKELASLDREVRAHEQAHKAAGGAHAGGIRLEFQTGPDGRNYAVGGEVPIDNSKAATPHETLAKARQVRQAALGPAQPSGQDLAVAAQASQMILEAQMEIAEQARAESAQSEKIPGSHPEKHPGDPSPYRVYQGAGGEPSASSRSLLLDLYT